MNLCNSPGTPHPLVLKNDYFTISDRAGSGSGHRETQISYTVRAQYVGKGWARVWGNGGPQAACGKAGGGAGGSVCREQAMVGAVQVCAGVCCARVCVGA